MGRFYKIACTIVFSLLLVSCAPVTEQNKRSAGKVDSSTAEQQVSEEALAYVKAIQMDDYQKAFNMLSEVHVQAGISVEQFKDDIQSLNQQLSNYQIDIQNVRERLPVEVSETNKEELFYLVSFDFESTSETREDYKSYSDSENSKWLNKRLWFHKESNGWKMFAAEDQQGVTWKPEVYSAALAFTHGLQAGDNEDVNQMLSEYYILRGENADSIPFYDGEIRSFFIKEISDDLKLSSEQVDEDVLSEIIRVTGNYSVTNYDIESEYRFDLFFHLENGVWKYLTDSAYDLENNYAFQCFLEKDCEKESTASIEEPLNKEGENQIINNGYNEEDDSAMSESESYDTAGKDAGNQIDSAILEEMLANRQTINVFFYKPDCPSCAASLTEITSAAAEAGEEVFIFDVSRDPSGWDQYGIEGIPELVIFREGVKFTHTSGNKNKEQFELYLLAS